MFSHKNLRSVELNHVDRQIFFGEIKSHWEQVCWDVGQTAWNGRYIVQEN
jgi:hypothetical protein